jgi:hypothetical protein
MRCFALRIRRPRVSRVMAMGTLLVSLGCGEGGSGPVFNPPSSSTPPPATESLVGKAPPGAKTGGPVTTKRTAITGGKTSIRGGGPVGAE